MGGYLVDPPPELAPLEPPVVAVADFDDELLLQAAKTNEPAAIIANSRERLAIDSSPLVRPRRPVCCFVRTTIQQYRH
jgi:hypothetical protein